MNKDKNKHKFSEEEYNIYVDFHKAFMETSKRDLKKGISRYSVQPGDADCSLSELALRVFGHPDGDNNTWLSYSNWLRDENKILGGRIPLKILIQDFRSLEVRNALLQVWLRKNHLLILP